MDICKLTGGNIRSLRKAAGLSQEELAFHAGIDRAYLSQLENGKKNISLLVLGQLADALKVAPDQLLKP
jgi:transcriptional regulator with XRE-family HTH domain